MTNETKQRLKFEASVTASSLDWWETEAKKVRDAILVFENDFFSDFDDPAYIELRGKAAYLLQKSRFEMRNLSNLRKKIVECA